MAIKFTTDIEEFTTVQKTERVKHFTEYTSKKQLENAGVLEAEELNFVKSIKNTFTFALHEEKRYMAITLYKANAEKKYGFLVLDLQAKAIAQVESIKTAKTEILALVAENKATAQEQTTEQQTNEQEVDAQTTEDTATEQETSEKPEKSKRGRKNTINK